MKNNLIVLLISIILFSIAGCEKDNIKLKNIEDVGLRVNFNSIKSANNFKNGLSLSTETPMNYFVALKSVKLLGTNGTSDIELFNEPNLESSFVFDYTDNNTVHSLLNGTAIPDGEYSSFEIEIYYLQMNITISTGERGIERRNIRIYLSDDAETEQGLHQAGDMTQINNNQEIGWLMGEGQTPNFDPVAPRINAYTTNGDGVSWYDFAGKSGENYGPFGDTEFMTEPHPIYKTTIGFNFVDNKGTDLILDFNVNNCWQYEDKNGDGAFGPDDLDPINPTKWHMALPEMTVTLQ